MKKKRRGIVALWQRWGAFCARGYAFLVERTFLAGAGLTSKTKQMCAAAPALMFEGV